MSCEYCRGTRTLIEQRDKLSRKGDFYPGLEVFMEGDVLNVIAVPDTYEPGYLEGAMNINFCPMCGEKLNGSATDHNHNESWSGLQAPNN